jgi:hypothetical protein
MSAGLRGTFGSLDEEQPERIRPMRARESAHFTREERLMPIIICLNRCFFLLDLHLLLTIYRRALL